ncbi:hypothetical protein LAZ67_2005876 [Cordylochernes scorpioides]|uniref:Integrase catalytic domain-containing protein n=1 Tax=Cordylochernes scorpioides TaxID=51811 RepID=A0ABY6K5P5_9ARAC|nr:hypothetical protein LAZ67_2005876 [Cordylochernes scorpioides]
MSKKANSDIPIFKIYVEEFNTYAKQFDEICQQRNIRRLKLYHTNIAELFKTIKETYYQIVRSNALEASETLFKEYIDVKNRYENFVFQIEEILDVENVSQPVKSEQSAISNVKLPKFNLPIFSGEMSQWLSFKDLFLVTIDKNTTLSDIQKLQYLHSSLKGDAARIIKGFPITENNYTQAWKTLVERYDNKRKIIFSQLDKIFKIKLYKISTSKAIYELLDICNESLRNLETIGLERNEMVDIMLIHFLQKKLDTPIRQQWELSYDNQELPSYQRFISFLAKQAQSLMNTMKDTTSKENLNKRFTSPKSVQPSNVPSTSTSCCVSEADGSIQILLSTAIIHIQDVNGEDQICRALLDNGSQRSLITEKCAAKLGIPIRRKRIAVGGLGDQLVESSLGEVLIRFSSHFDHQSFETTALVLTKLTNNIPSFTVKKINYSHMKGLILADPSYFKSREIDVILGSDIVFNLIQEGRRNGNEKSFRNMAHFSSELESEDLIKRFWELESIPLEEIPTKEEKDCESHYLKNVVRDESGRYIVRLPFKESAEKLGQSKSIAISRFLNLEKRLEQNENIYVQYKQFMNEYIRLGHMQASSSLQTEPKYYIPHHCILKAQPTKLRVVFDASTKTTTQISLNDLLHVGPKLQNNIFSILLKFRTNSVALVADIEKMYRQIRLHPDDIKYQTILWRDRKDLELQEYNLISKIIREDFYVDDLLTGCPTVEDAKGLMQQLIAVLGSGGFVLRKWVSNETSIIEDLPLLLRGKGEVMELNRKESGVNVLGIQWDPSYDTLNISCKSGPADIKSKRQIVSAIARIYDPCGWLSPTTVVLKLLLQELWKLKIGWDEDIPASIQRKWNTFEREMKHFQQISIPRCIFQRNLLISNMQLHGFCDSSELAYSAVCYLRITYENNQIETILLTAKTKVALIKKITIPRLELCAALMLAQLQSQTTQALPFNIDEQFYWTDSKIVLAWITSESKKWQIFVANRVAKIQDLTAAHSWQYISGKQNPADLATRGILPSCLSIQNYGGMDPFINITRKQPTQRLSFLTSQDLKDSLLQIVKIIQRCEFTPEINACMKNIPLPRKSRLISLNIFIDSQGILRVGGRLRHSDLDIDQKHPMLIPKDHFVTKLIVLHYHLNNLHSGTQLTLSLIRNKFWIPSGRNLIKRVLNQCLVCLKSKSKAIHQIMGDLPKNRLLPGRPFEKIGIDLAGPIQAKPMLKRSKVIFKFYIVLFVCFTTKAIHLEISSDLTAEAFLAALKRFISRRGRPTEIYSDNATNFKGASNILKERWKLFKAANIQDFSAIESINWHFIPPSAPNFGGLWEAGIKSVKTILSKTMKSRLLNYEELLTLLAQIEACLNSRPLTFVSNDPNDLTALTPGHFLIGNAMRHDAESDHSTLNLRSRWDLIQPQRDYFWNRWSCEYLHQLQERRKWRTSHPDVKIGDLVMLKEQNKPLQWKLARIVQIFPGEDDHVRVVLLRTPKGLLKRPITKICPLPYREAFNLGTAEKDACLDSPVTARRQFEALSGTSKYFDTLVEILKVSLEKALSCVNGSRLPSLPDLGGALCVHRPARTNFRDEEENIIEGRDLRRRVYKIARQSSNLIAVEFIRGTTTHPGEGLPGETICTACSTWPKRTS